MICHLTGWYNYSEASPMLPSDSHNSQDGANTGAGTHGAPSMKRCADGYPQRGECFAAHATGAGPTHGGVVAHHSVGCMAGTTRGYTISITIAMLAFH